MVPLLPVGIRLERGAADFSWALIQLLAMRLKTWAAIEAPDLAYTLKSSEANLEIPV